jgi:K+-sensing histidine kinase KdpD
MTWKGSEKMGHQATIAFLAQPTGSIIAVLHDELGLTTCLESGSLFKAILDPRSVPHAALFLDTIQKDGFAFGCKLNVVCADGPMSLIFLGCKSDCGMFIIGSREALSRKSLVQELTAIVDHYAAQLQTPEESRYASALLAATAHELRNPLNGILAASQYLLDDAAHLLKPEHITLLRSVESSGRAMFRLIDDLIEASATESGELKLVPAPTDILDLIRKNLSLNRLSAARKEIRMELSSAGDLPLIPLDPVSISRVVDNLLTKCIQSSWPGGRIEIYVGIEERQAIISVQSEKSNLSAEELRFLSSSLQGGMSGLPKVKPSEIIAFRMVNKIVERHGGNIQVESNAGKGLTFILALPIPGVRVLKQRHA